MIPLRTEMCTIHRATVLVYHELDLRASSTGALQLRIYTPAL